MNDQSVEKLLDEAISLIKGGERLERAALLLQQATKKEESSFTAWYYLGLAYFQAEQHEKAVRAFECALKRGESPDLWSRYGMALTEMGDFDEGRRALKRASNLGQSKTPLFQVACSYEREGRSREAVNALLEYLDEEHDDPDGWEFLHIIASEAAAAEEATAFRDEHCDAAMSDLLASRQRLVESGDGFPLEAADHEHGHNLKTAFANRLGRVLLGSASDDGLVVPPYSDTRLGLDHFGVSFARLLGLLEVFDIKVGAVVPADERSALLGQILADALSVPLATDPAAATPEGRPHLLFMMDGTNYLTYHRLRAAMPRPSLSFVMALSWMDQGLTFEAEHVPDITGVVGHRLSTPPLDELRSQSFAGFLQGSLSRHRVSEKRHQQEFHAGRREAFRFPDLSD